LDNNNNKAKTGTQTKGYSFRNDKIQYPVTKKITKSLLGSQLEESILFNKQIKEDDYLNNDGSKKLNDNGSMITNLDVRKSLVKCNNKPYDIYIKYSVDRSKYLVSCGHDNGKTTSLSFFNNMFQGLGAAYEFIVKHSMAK
jgi:hypothetical protein